MFLDQVFINVCAIEKNEWSFVDIKLINKKIDKIESFTKNYLQKLLEKQKLMFEKNKVDKKKESSFMEKITKRIIDNIQINIKNIHIRFEDIKDFSFGITLDELQIFTTNKDWKKEFIG